MEGNILEKSDKLILKAFLEMEVPNDFEIRVSTSAVIDALTGLVTRMLSHEKLDKNEVEQYSLNSECKNVFFELISDNLENLLYYYLIKMCYLLLRKYSR